MNDSKASARHFRFGRAAAQLDSDVDSLIFAQDRDLNDVAGFQAFDGFAEIGDRADVFAVDCDDQVSRASVEAFEDERASSLAEKRGASDSSLFGGAFGSQTLDQQAFFSFENSLDADFRSVDAAVGDQFRDDS